MREKMLGIVGLVIGGGILAVTAYQNSPAPASPVIFSPRMVLLSLWREYKTKYWEPDTGRALNTDEITTSEAESYTLLRAVWLDDQEAFDKTWKWMRAHLSHKEDALMSWIYGKRPDGSYGVLTESGGENSASDADTDTALSLLFAYSRWHQNDYLSAAQALMRDIWRYEVVTVGGKPYLTADNIERLSPDRLILNPSYLAPYAYRIFQKFDPEHDWNGLIDTSYEVIEEASANPLGHTTSAGLPPDWVALDRRTGEFLSTLSGSTLSTNYGYDALRVAWRVALDWQWFGDQRAERALSHFGFLKEEWNRNRALAAVYGHDGTVVSGYESPANYGGAIGYFAVISPDLAREVYASKLAALYSPDINEWQTPLNYYDDNWVWFGIGLYNGALPNLARVEMARRSASVSLAP